MTQSQASIRFLYISCPFSEKVMWLEHYSDIIKGDVSEEKS